MTDHPAFWAMLEELVAQSPLVIDRPAGTAHPRFPQLVYPLGYGYLAGTVAMDGGGIDVWRGSLPQPTLDGLIITVDTLKKDSEIKLLLGCTQGERQTALAFHNGGGMMKGLLVERPG